MGHGDLLTPLTRNTLLPQTVMDSHGGGSFDASDLQRRLPGALTRSQGLAGLVKQTGLPPCPPVRVSRLSGHQLPSLAPDPASGVQFPFPVPAGIPARRSGMLMWPSEQPAPLWRPLSWRAARPCWQGGGHPRR